MKLSIVFVLMGCLALQACVEAKRGRRTTMADRNDDGEEVTRPKTTTRRPKPPMPGRCGKHEEMHPCGNQCDLTYDNYGMPYVTHGRCRRACVCQRGYYRNYRGRCVLNKKKCRYNNEYFVRCGSGCDSHCKARPCAVSRNYISGFYCKPGFSRQCNTKQCIPTNQCPRKRQYYD